MYQQTPEKDLTTYANYIIRLSNQTSQAGFDYASEGHRADKKDYIWDRWAYIDVANRAACQMVKCAKETDGLPTAMKHQHIANVSAYQKWHFAYLEHKEYVEKESGRFDVIAESKHLADLAVIYYARSRTLAQGYELVPLLEVYRAVLTARNYRYPWSEELYEKHLTSMRAAGVPGV